MQNEHGVTVHPCPREKLDEIVDDGEYGELHTDDPEFEDLDPKAGTYRGPVVVLETGRPPFAPVYPLRKELEEALLGYHAGHRCWEAVIAVA